jgi:hypothetical protein
MGLTNEQIKELLGWFIHESDNFRIWGGKRKLGTEENHQWIQPDAIRKIL